MANGRIKLRNAGIVLLITLFLLSVNELVPKHLHNILMAAYLVTASMIMFWFGIKAGAADDERFGIFAGFCILPVIIYSSKATLLQIICWTAAFSMVPTISYMLGRMLCKLRH
ncbi:MAG: hypothetical protein ABFD83_07135 [Armatimonadota bacterium]